MTDQSSPEQLTANLVALLDVANHGSDRFEGPRKGGGVGRVFGGQVIAQALAAAQHTVEADRAVHSLHAYFLRGGSEDHPIELRVERDFDGGSFSNRRVVASQQDRPILNFVASFHRAEQGFSHCAEPMPDVPPPEALEPEAEVIRRFLGEVGPERRRRLSGPRPVEFRASTPRVWMRGEPGPPVQNAWFRTVAPLPDDPALHRVVLAYASDMLLLGTSAIPHGVSPAHEDVITASIDHAVWFHEDARADQWLLYATDSPWSGGARGFNRGRVYTRDGRLVAETAQEGLIRPRPKVQAGPTA